MKIGMDVDGVLYDWGRTARMLLEWHHGVPYAPEDGYWSIKENCTAEQWRWLWSEGVKRFGLFRHGNMVKGALEGMHALSAAGHEFHYVTKRPEAARRDTGEWLRFHGFPIGILSVLGNPDAKKSEVHQGADVYVDDSPEVVVDLLLNTEAKVCLFDQPWNQRMRGHPWEIPPGGRLVRVPGWRELVDEVEYPQRYMEVDA